MPKFWNETEVYARDKGLDQKIEYDASNNPIYIGMANPGVAITEAGWQIYKMEYDASNNMTSMRWADATDDFIKIWDSRASYSFLDI